MLNINGVTYLNVYSWSEARAKYEVVSVVDTLKANKKWRKKKSEAKDRARRNEIVKNNFKLVKK